MATCPSRGVLLYCVTQQPFLSNTQSTTHQPWAASVSIAANFAEIAMVPKFRKIKQRHAQSQFADLFVADLLDHPKVEETRQHIHHSIPKHDHIMRVTRYSYRLAKLMRADARVCTRAAVMHD